MVEQRDEKDTMKAVKMAESKVVRMDRLWDEATGMIAAEKMERWMVARVVAMMVEKKVCCKAVSDI